MKNKGSCCLKSRVLSKHLIIMDLHPHFDSCEISWNFWIEIPFKNTMRKTKKYIFKCKQKKLLYRTCFSEIKKIQFQLNFIWNSPKSHLRILHLFSYRQATLKLKFRNKFRKIRNSPLRMKFWRHCVIFAQQIAKMSHSEIKIEIHESACC